jgi:hypothetical protein
MTGKKKMFMETMVFTRFLDFRGPGRVIVTRQVNVDETAAIPC